MHTHVAKNGTRIFYNSDFSGMAIILGAQYGEVEVPAADARMLIEGEAILREIAALHDDGLCTVGDYSGDAYCVFCDGGERQPSSPQAIQIGVTPWRVWHEPDCLWLRAKRLVEGA